MLSRQRVQRVRAPVAVGVVTPGDLRIVKCEYRAQGLKCRSKAHREGREEDAKAAKVFISKKRFNGDSAANLRMSDIEL
jgi:hypothetical protein